MKPTLLLSALLSCFVLQGNAQESVPASPAATSYATQGNVAQNKSVYDQEMERAAFEARKVKELKAAIASQSFGPPPAPITSASQYLAANRPPVPPPSQAPAAERPAAEVPTFNTAPSSPATSSAAPPRPSSPNAGVPDFELPQKQERSFFKWLKNKKEEPQYEDLPLVGESQYQENPYETPGTMSDPPAPPAPASSNGIPDVPAMGESVPVPQAPTAQEEAGPAPIFVRRGSETSQGSETARIEKDSEALVNGVLVKLFAGTQVTVLSKTVNDATVRLPDGRVGTVKRRSLSR